MASMTRGLRHVRRGPRRIVLGVAASAAGRCLLALLACLVEEQCRLSRLQIWKGGGVATNAVAVLMGADIGCI